MSKIVKTVIVVAIAVAVVVFAPQIAAVLASVAGSLGVTVAATAISSALIGMSISMALTAAATLFRKAPSMSQSMVDRLNTSVVPTASRKIIFGTTAGGADVRFFEGDLDLPSTKKDGYVQVVALASHRINALKQFYVENDLVWQNGAFVSKRNGFAPNNPFRVVTEGKPGNGFSVGSGRYWNSASTFTGCAYYVPFWKLDTDVWESGIPQRLTAIVEGCPLYDPRRDSTRGGSGAHRVNDQNTYAFRDGAVEIGRNPALALLTYLLGWRINGKVVWGMGIPANRIDFDNFRTYANLCEEGVAVQGGGTVQRYTADGIFSTTDSHETVINGLTAAMGSCKLTDRGGTYGIVGGYDDTAGPKVAFDADDLVAPANGSSPYIWNPAPASRERFNIVRGRFANPEELYQLTDWGNPIEREPLADGIPRTMSIDLGAVSRAETCQRIAKQMLLREYLCPGMFSATFGPKAFAVEIGSVITLSLPAEGWNNKLFRVMEQAESHDLFFQMTLREEDPAIYAWDREEKPLPATIRPQGYDASTTIAPANLALTSASYSGANGVNVSEVHVTWTPELSGRVNGIQIQSRPAGTDAWSEQAALFDPKIGTFTFTSNAPGITVEVCARFRMMSAVYSPWVNASVATAEVITITDWENVTDTSGTRPADNATVGAPVGTNVGGVEAGTLVNTANTANTNASTALNAVKDKNGTVTGIQTVIDSVAAEVTRAKQEVAATRTSLNTDIAAAKQEGTTARNDLAAAKTALSTDIAAAKQEGTTARNDLASYKTQANTDIAAAKQEGTTARNDLATEVTRAKNAEGSITTKVTQAQSTADGAATAITTEQTTRANADTALSNRATSLESTVNDAAKGNTALQSRISTEETTRANADTAIASRATILESKAGNNGAINTNPTFALYSNPTGTPNGWNVDNQAPGATRVAGETGGYALQVAAAANANGYASQTLRQIEAGTWWVIEADIKLISGTLAGAGVLFRVTDDFVINFASDLTTSDATVGAGVTGRYYNYRKLVKINSFTTAPTLYYMNHWSALGSIAAANTIQWFRCAARPATDAEIAAKRADANANTALSKISTEETTRANADSALATRATNLETTINTPVSGLSARMSTEETARANADSALASRASVIESSASTGSGVLNANPNFMLWSDSNTYPNGWTGWASEGSIARIPSGAPTGGYAVRTNGNGNGNYGFAQMDVNGPMFTNGYYVLEADVELHSGTWQGSGLTIQGHANLDFARDTDTYGAGANSTFIGRRKFSKVVKLEVSTDRNWHAMVNWDGFGALVAKSMTWYRVAARPATQGEIDGTLGRADAATANARISTEETTRANADGALATRATNLESTVNTGANRNAALRSSITDEATTRTNADNALATKTDTMITEYRGNNTNLNSRIFNEETTRANADSALATRASTLEARTIGGGNLITNTDFLSSVSGVVADGWVSGSAIAVAPTFGVNIAGDAWHLPNENAISIYQSGQAGASGYTLWASNRFAVSAGAYFQAYCFMASHRCQTELIIYWFDSSNNTLTASVSGAQGGTGNEMNGGQNLAGWRQQGIPSVVVPSGAVSASLELRKYNTNAGQSDSYAWFTRPYAGAARSNTNEYTPFSPGSAKAGLSGTVARISTEETTRANADSALSTRASNLESTVNSGPDRNGALRASISDEATTRSNNDSALATRASNLETSVNNGSTGNLALQGKITDEATSRSTADSALATRASTLEAGATNSGNIVPNTALTTLDGWQLTYSAKGATMSSNAAGANWQIGGVENNLSLTQTPAGDGYMAEAQSPLFALTPGEWYQVQALTASHRCNSWVSLFFYNASGQMVGYAGENYGPRINAGGQSMTAHDITGNKSAQAPAGTVFGRVVFRIYNVTNDGYGWFHRPYVGLVKANTNQWNAYGPGSDRPIVSATLARIGNEQTARANADSALATRASTLETSVNNGATGNLSLSGKITDEATTRSNADSAISNRVSTTEAKLNGDQDSTLAARIRDEQTARANADSAVAARTSFLETTASASSGPNIITNDKFAIWRDGQTNPDGWNTWSGSGNYRTERSPGIKGSPYSFRTLNDNADVNSGFVQSVRVTPGKWVFEVTVESDGSGFRGAGLTLSGIYSLDFLSVADVNGAVGDSGNSIRSWSMVFDITHNEFLSFHCMHGWTGFSRGVAAKYMKWHAVSLRPAGPGDIAGVKNAADIATANVRIGNEETARSNADSALGTRTNTLESNYSTVRNNLDTWNNDRYNDYVRVNSRVAAEETTRANADSAIANRTSVVEAQVSSDANNMLRNGIFNAPNWVGRGGSGVPPQWAPWSNENGAFLGASPRDSRYGAPAPLQIDRNGGKNNGIYQGVNNVGPGWYVFEIDITGEDGNWSGSGLHCNFNNGTAVNYGFAINADTAGRTGDIGTANRQFSFMIYNPSNTATANVYLMSGWTSFQGDTNFGFFRGVWHRVVMRPASEGEIQARKVQDSNLIARVSTTESAVSSLNGRAAAYWQTTAVAGNNRAQLTVRADANGGAGVDIVGDVNFSGNLNVGPDSGGNRMKLTNSGLWLYDANGTLRAQLSL